MKRLLLLAIGLCCTNSMLLGCSSKTAEPAPVPDTRLYGKTSMVEVPYRQYGMAKKVDDRLYMTVDSGDGRIDTVVRFDPATGESERLLQSPDEIAWIAVSEDWLVWESGLQLQARSLRSAETTVLGSSQDVFAPAIVGRTVAWMDKQEGGDYDLVVQDLGGGTVRKVADINLPGFYNNFVDFDGERLLWTDIIDGEGFYRVADVDSGVIEDFQIEGTPFRYPGYAQSSGDRFYSINFDNHKEWDWTRQQFGYYSPKSGTFTPVIDERYINFFRACGDRVAVLDGRQHLLLFDGQDPTQPEDLSEQLGVTFDKLDLAGGDTLVASVSQETEASVSCTLCLIETR